MKSRYSIVTAALLCALGLAACNKASVRTDAQVASEVQTNLRADSNIVAKDIAVQADRGIVTLTGTVNNDNERTAAASDAARVDGVRTVVNNLVVQHAETSSETEVPPAARSTATAKRPAVESKKDPLRPLLQLTLNRNQ